MLAHLIVECFKKGGILSCFIKLNGCGRPLSLLSEQVDLLLWINSFPSPCLLAMRTLLPYIQSSVVLKLIADNFPSLSVISDKYFCFPIVTVFPLLSNLNLAELFC